MLENIEDITYDGVRLSEIAGDSLASYMTINAVRGRGLVDTVEETIVVPSSREYPTTRRLDTRIIEVDISVKGVTFEDLRLKIERLSGDLLRNKDVPITFADEPGRTYYGRYSSSSEMLEESKIAKFTIFITCYDPMKYGQEQTYPISGAVTIPNEGTADTYPILDLTVTKDSTLVYIGNLSNMSPQGDAMAIYLGTESNVGDEVEDVRQLILHDTMQSTSGWTGASSIDSGVISGTMAADTDGFYAESYGDENDEGSQNIWVGPSLKRSLPSTVKDFIANVTLSNRNYRDNAGDLIGDAGVGIIEVYFRDINDRMVAKFQFGDTAYNAAINHVVFASPPMRHTYQSANPLNWNDFEGFIQIARERNHFYPKIVRYKNGRYVGERDFGVLIPSKDGVGTHGVASIQVAVRKYHKSKRIFQRIKEIKVFETHYSREEEVAPLEFKVGDRIHIDVQKGLFLLNDEQRTDLVHLDSDFFTLVEGLNMLETSGNVTGTVTFRERYL